MLFHTFFIYETFFLVDVANSQLCRGRIVLCVNKSLTLSSKAQARESGLGLQLSFLKK